MKKTIGPLLLLLTIITNAQFGQQSQVARGMFMAAVAAGPVYKLLGKKDLGATEFPKVETGLLEGEVAFRQHSAGYTPGPNGLYSSITLVIISNKTNL